MSIKTAVILSALQLCFILASAQQSEPAMKEKKIVLYQLLPRLFGNKQTNNVPFGDRRQNGCGKFDDITTVALNSIKELHVNYVWYTGIIAHASMSDYTAYGIPRDDADVVKGLAGSPYAIRDYYDVDPDLAADPAKRMQEFETLLARTHAAGLKVLIDFVPNHVARSYKSLMKPAGVSDFGSSDDTGKAFSAANDFYYIPGKALKVPGFPKADDAFSRLRDGKYSEFPARATGNNVFSEKPSADDWYETIKLNYGVDHSSKGKTYFEPRPALWDKMKDILNYWAGKGVDGFRCDVAEMVPVEFWAWVIPELKKTYPGLVFLAEAYDPSVYETYLKRGHFDYLYDKVGLYDALKKLIRNQPDANTADIEAVWRKQTAGFDGQMLRFLENHDEERIASRFFAGGPEAALPAFVITATLGSGPVMVYNGQEVGEPGLGAEGFGKDDGRSTIFDYWGMPEHQKWMNGGTFDGGKLSAGQQKLRKAYQRILNIAARHPAMSGKTESLPVNNTRSNRVYGYFRTSAAGRLLILVNFDRTQSWQETFTLPFEAKAGAKELLTDSRFKLPAPNRLNVSVAAGTAKIIEF
ncbi:alpha-amylase family protein [Pedobacter sp. SYP-B3415]|uniref:alpha-amylase family protein n=1 Tax=Pedobacter sp. SYP-B3415 TaxID=2496641 RepID=UPI001F115A4B|nr:alpha-amylase family protein [Pedobacter sp. SYP-B3415]